MNGWSPSVIATTSASASAATPVRSENPWPCAQSSHSTTSARAEVDRGADRVRVVAEHDDHAPQRRVHGVDGVLQQRPAAQVRELLGLLAEAGAGACGEDQPRGGPGHATPSSIRSASASSEEIELPGSSRSTCGIAAFMPRVSGS